MLDSMILFQVEGVQKHYRPRAGPRRGDIRVRPGERIGLVGPNGAGKTTLMRILADKEEADGGSIVRHPSLHVGYLEQQPQWEPGRTLLDEAKSALAGLMAMEAELISVAQELGHCDDPLEHKRLADRYDHLQHEMQTRDAYNLDHKIERVLDGLRFRRESFNQPVESLSGGEQNRLMLAKLLLAEPNVMLLDEPSNHLDIEATQWLESFLAESAAAMLLVSHDRYFLDRVTNRTLELFQGTVDSYTGNFSAYWTQKAERLLVQQRTYEKQQIEIEKAKDFIRRNHYGQKHQQAEDRRKKLERIELVALPRAIALPPMGFPPASRSGDIVVRAEGLAKAFERPLFSRVDLQIVRGQRWGLIGPNGCGKSTLLRCLLGEERPDAGVVQLGAGVSVGYFDQHLSGVSDDDDVVDSIRPSHKQFLTDLSGALDRETGVLIRAPWLGTEAAAVDLFTPAIVPAHPAVIALALMLERLQQAAPVRLAAATVLLPSSEFGRAAMDELHQQTVNLLNFQGLPRGVYDAQAAFNLLSGMAKRLR